MKTTRPNPLIGSADRTGREVQSQPQASASGSQTLPISSPPICDYEGSDYQDRFWEIADRSYEDQVEAVALRRLVPKRGQRLLEVGAGAGRNTPRYHGFDQIFLLDYAVSQLRMAQERLGRSDRFVFVAADAYHLPFAPQAFDAATMIRTLHHMADPLAALAQVRGVLRTGSAFVLEFASKRNLKAIMRWLARRQAWNPFDLRPVEFAALNFDFHPRAVRAWLEEAGFGVRRQLTVSHFRHPLLKRLAPTRWLVALDALAQWTGGLWQLTPSVFVGAQAVGPDEENPQGTFWRCPACRSIDLEEGRDGVRCRNCGRFWPLEDGIYVFKPAMEDEGQSGGL
jgi:ubiquinone/menaquinone biosynthesis C-methylase UbiE